MDVSLLSPAAFLSPGLVAETAEVGCVAGCGAVSVQRGRSALSLQGRAARRLHRLRVVALPCTLKRRV